MNAKIFFLSLLLIFSSSSLYAKENKDITFLLKPNDDTSFMHYEFHNLAYEAASKKDYKDAYRIYLKLANKGDNRAEYNIGMMYMNGLGVEHKKMDAYKWLRRASKHGNTEATLYFKQMNERYEKKHQRKTMKKKTKKKELPEPKPVEENTSAPIIAEPEIIKPVEKIQTKQTMPVVHNQEEVKRENSPPLLYMIMAGLIVILSLVFFFFKKSKHIEKKEEKSPQSTPKYKSQMYDITYAHISQYHNELLKQVDLTRFKADKNKMQIYYMFLYGMIDYFCQLEKFTDTEQRRIFSTHMGKQEGQENITAIMQSILEGQKDHSMYHYQAAGGISAKAWYEEKSKDALSMLKKVLSEKRD